MKRLVRSVFIGAALLFFGPPLVALVVINIWMFIQAPLFYVLLATAVVAGCAAAAFALLWAFDS